MTVEPLASANAASAGSPAGSSSGMLTVAEVVDATTRTRVVAAGTLASPSETATLASVTPGRGSTR